MPLYDIRYATPLSPEEADPEKDLIPVWHGASGSNANRSMTLSSLAAAVGDAPPPGGVSQATFDAFKAAVINDLNNLRDKVALMATSLDADAGVATTTFAATCTPPPITAA